MYLVLLSVGLLVTAAGFLTIGFGIPINAFSLGNTLIIAGTVAVAGGLILIGIAAAVRQLNRIAETLNGRPVARPSKVADGTDTLVPPTARIPPAPARTPAPPKPPEFVMPRPPESRPAPEPYFPAAASEAPGPLDWMRPKRKSSTGQSSTGQSSDSEPSAVMPPPGNIEPPVMDVQDEAPLSPRAPQRPLFSPSQFSAPARESQDSYQEPQVEPKAWSPSRGGAPEPRAHETPQAAVPRSEQVVRTSPPGDRPKDTAKDTTNDTAKDFAKDLEKDLNRDSGKPAGKDAGLFDVAWPDARSAPMPAEPARRETKPDPAPPPPRSREESHADKRADSGAADSAERSANILKSGVIDGMAYTLYVDGSIEAELPQGTVRFASVDALRVHLEKSI